VAHVDAASLAYTLNNESAEPRVADWVTRNAGDVQRRCLNITAGRRRHDCSGKPGWTTPYTIRPWPDLERTLPEEATITPKPEALR
jgi:hypothetical protein